ncbi:hypothetical protein H8N01_15170 [Streptomyces sp. AC536]|uniref:hypothetical protein n=1 Tax=Streptomyces buecherae TaxID=2763006 RepID=UPI00164D6D09|nr:hypothetical protein [Streptomyces buecherae]MBC3983865.1 hypothetical protein [Streptomyces buecherae]QNJ42763.1 hypothetical protein H7H31_25935 [Streptomyces buecherae]
MNIRSLTRGDGVVIGAAVLLFVASFLDFLAIECPSGVPSSQCSSWNGWSSDFASNTAGIFILGVVGAALVVLSHLLPQRNLVGLTLEQWGTALAVAAAFTSTWTMLFSHPDGMEKGVGQILGFIALLLLAGAVLAGPRVPALKAPLMGAASPQPAPSPYGGQPGQVGQPAGGYGYPSGQQPGAPSPYGAPAGGQPSYGGQPGGASAAPAAAGAGAGEFAPFWFAVPVARPLYAEDGSATPIAELAPGTWYLAVEQRGQALVAQTQDGRRGVLQDTTGIQRG